MEAPRVGAAPTSLVQTGAVISVDLARSLRTAGVRWEPRNGDWFVVDAAELLDQRLVLSDITVDVHATRAGTILGFNGTTEWALDSVGVEDTLWLPLEHQLRELLGDSFDHLDHVDGTWRVVLTIDGSPINFSDPECTEAYGRAVLHVRTR